MNKLFKMLMTLAAMVMLFPLGAYAQQTTFEAPKTVDSNFNGVDVSVGADFALQFQTLRHSNTLGNLVELGNGFNLATANMKLGAQLAPGVSVHLTTYLSSQHHTEAWVKGGYMLVEQMPSGFLDGLFEFMTVKAGHMEINYGDAHFFRTDNGDAIGNPFVGNLIMDSFATEIGGEVYLRTGALMGMVGVTAGEIKGRVERPDDRAPSIYTKLAYDNQLSDNFRLRLAGSMYTTAKSLSNTLHAGDRAGTRFYNVMVEGIGDGYKNGRLSPGFRNSLTAYQFNPFVQLGNLEVMGTYETVTGTKKAGADEGTWNQMAVDVLYRLFDDAAYVGARYNTVDGEGDVSSDRIQVAGGWFMTPNVLVKLNYVTQDYSGYADDNILNGGQFDGFTLEGVISF